MNARPLSTEAELALTSGRQILTSISKPSKRKDETHARPPPNGRKVRIVTMHMRDRTEITEDSGRS